ncbi:MAG TPA: DUF202 domain-containing protein [Actinomycetales bacterium]
MTQDRPAPPATQVERTALAWQRTAVSTLVLATLSLGAAARTQRAGAVLVTALATVVVAVAALAVRPGAPASVSRRLVLVATGAVAMAVAGAVLAALAVVSRGAHAPL